MSIWLVFWLLLVVVFAGFVIWTSVILLRQKSAWKEYADKRKLRYKRGGLMQSPEVQGVIDNHRVSVFTSEHMVDNARNNRKLMAIEVNLNSVMPVAGGVASGGLVSVLKSMELKQEYAPKHERWNKAYVAMADSRGVMSRYLTDARVEALAGLMGLKHAWVILAFRDDKMLLRIDTADPLDSAAALDKIVKAMLAAAEALELGSGESKVLKSDAVKAEAQAVSLEVDDEALDVGGLQLEENENEVSSEESEKP
ncbi:MAG: hypothetical protein ACRBCT_01215 [Alphaproteobacteria bacterium]